MLSEAAQALLNIGKAPETDTVETYDEDQVPSGPIEDGYSTSRADSRIWWTGFMTTCPRRSCSCAILTKAWRYPALSCV